MRVRLLIKTPAGPFPAIPNRVVVRSDFLASSGAFLEAASRGRPLVCSGFLVSVAAAFSGIEQCWALGPEGGLLSHGSW